MPHSSSRVVKTIVTILLLSSIYFSAKLFFIKTPITNNHSFQIAILDRNLNYGPHSLGYDLQTSWPILQKAYPAQVVYSLTEGDIETYNWSEQIVTLTPEASSRILDKLGNCNGIYKKPVDCLLLHAFVVVYDDSPVYGGVFFPDWPVATAAFFPIIYPDFDHKQVTFTIRPYQSLFYPFNETDWQTIKDERIKSLFIEVDKLVK